MKIIVIIAFFFPTGNTQVTVNIGKPRPILFKYMYMAVKIKSITDMFKPLWIYVDNIF